MAIEVRAYGSNPPLGVNTTYGDDNQVCRACGYAVSRKVRMAQKPGEPGWYHVSCLHAKAEAQPQPQDALAALGAPVDASIRAKPPKAVSEPPAKPQRHPDEVAYFDDGPNPPGFSKRRKRDEGRADELRDGQLWD
jgi:hypothetical protein